MLDHDNIILLISSTGLCYYHLPLIYSDLLRYELKILQDIFQCLDPGKIETSGPADPEQWEKTLLNECIRIKEAWTASAFYEPRDNVLKRYIGFHQLDIVRLADQAEVFRSSYQDAFREDNYSQIYKQFISSQIDLLDYLELFFPKYFNADIKIPDTSINKLVAVLGPAKHSINISTLHNDLKECLYAYLENFQPDQKNVCVTYRDLYYLKEFLKEINSCLADPDDKDQNRKLIRSLIGINFNSLQFFAYYQDNTRRETDEAYDYEHYSEILHRHLLFIKNMQLKPGLICHKGWPSVKSILESWLNHEIEFISQARKRYETLKDGLAGQPDQTLSIDLSVAQLACLLKLFMEQGMFPGYTISDVLRFFASHFSSKRQKHISAGSLSKEYYDISQSAADAIRRILEKLTLRINKEFFPVILAIYLTFCFL